MRRLALVAAALLASHAALAQLAQQGPKLTGSGAVGNALQGRSVSLSADGHTSIVGGILDNGGIGAAWVWTRTATAGRSKETNWPASPRSETPIKATSWPSAPPPTPPAPVARSTKASPARSGSSAPSPQDATPSGGDRERKRKCLDHSAFRSTSSSWFSSASSSGRQRASARKPATHPCSASWPSSR